jgi:hypothetical protein
VIVAAWLVLSSVTPAAAVSIGFPSTGPTAPTFELSPTPPSPSLPGLTSYTFDLGKLFPMAFPGATSPNPLPTGMFAESASSFHLALLAGFGRIGFIDPVVADQTFTFFVVGNSWSVQTRLEYSAAGFPLFDADVVSMKGDVVHRIAPHPGEFKPGDAVNYDVLLHGARSLTVPPRFESQLSNQALMAELKASGIQIPADARFGIDVNGATHPGGSHDDVVLAVLAGKVTRVVPGITRDDFEWWMGGVSGLHVVPEPSTLLLLGAGLGAAALGARRRLRKDRERGAAPAGPGSAPRAPTAP